MNSTAATLKRKQSLDEDDLSCSIADPEEKVRKDEGSRKETSSTNSYAELFDRVALPNTDIPRKDRENALNTKHISNSNGLGSAPNYDGRNHSPACNMRFQSWVDERKDRERIRNVERAARKVLEEVRASKDTVYVQYKVVHEDESSDEEEEEDLCFQYDVDALPQTEIDLDEIDEFLEHDIFMQELLE